MNKEAFLSALRRQLAGLPQADVQRSLDYYTECIDDRVEEGMDPEAAVLALGPVEEIVAQLQVEVPHDAQKCRKSGKPVWITLLLILGAPLWLPLLATVVLLALAAWLVLWSVVVAGYALMLSAGAGALAGLAGCLPYLVSGRWAPGILCVGVGLLCGGMTIPLFFAATSAAGVTLRLTGKTLRGVARFFKGGR